MHARVDPGPSWRAAGGRPRRRARAAGAAPCAALHSVWNYRRAELIKFGWAQINQVALVISGPFLVISDVPLGEFKMVFVLLNIPHTLVPSPVRILPSICFQDHDGGVWAYTDFVYACYVC